MEIKIIRSRGFGSQTTQIEESHVVVLHRTAKKYTKF